MVMTHKISKIDPPSPEAVHIAYQLDSAAPSLSYSFYSASSDMNSLKVHQQVAAEALNTHKEDSPSGFTPADLDEAWIKISDLYEFRDRLFDMSVNRCEEIIPNASQMWGAAMHALYSPSEQQVYLWSNEATEEFLGNTEWRELVKAVGRDTAAEIYNDNYLHSLICTISLPKYSCLMVIVATEYKLELGSRLTGFTGIRQPGRTLR